jgi:hypothetical protein
MDPNPLVAMAIMVILSIGHVEKPRNRVGLLDGRQPAGATFPAFEPNFVP